MKKTTIKTYAVKHKMSIFSVMKMIKSGQLKTEIIEENEKEVTYILLDDVMEKEIQEDHLSIRKQEEFSLREAVKILQKEVKLLREEMEVLKKKL